jgi:hypothetical protein
MRTYVPDQWLRTWFLGGKADVQYDFTNQLAHGSPEEFSSQLAQVWQRCAEVCRDGAQMIVRFGGIRTRRQDPRAIFRESLRGSGWRLQTARAAGTSTRGKRQAPQFGRSLESPVEEHDFYLRLED